MEDFILCRCAFLAIRHTLRDAVQRRRVKSTLVWDIGVVQNLFPHFTHPSPDFTGVKKCDILRRFSTIG